MRKTLLALTVMLLCSTNAFASDAAPTTLDFSSVDVTDDNAQATMIEIQSIVYNHDQELKGYAVVPPGRFNQMYNGTIHIHLVPYARMDDYCGKVGEGDFVTVAACTVIKSATECDMYLPISTPITILNGRLDALFYHERGHAEGWSRKHES